MREIGNSVLMVLILRCLLDEQWQCQVSGRVCQLGVGERALSWKYKIGSCPHIDGSRAGLGFMGLKLM